MATLTGLTALDPWRFAPAPLAIVLGGQLLTSAAVLGFTEPESVVRVAVVPALLSCVYMYGKTGAPRFVRGPWAGLLGGTGAAYLLQYLDLAVLRGDWSYRSRAGGRWDEYEAKRPKKKGEVPSPFSGHRPHSVWSRLQFGLQSMLGFRHLWAHDEVANVPPFQPDDPEYVPTRRQLLLRNLAVFASFYLLLDFLSSNNSPPEDPMALFGPDKVALFGRWSSLTMDDLQLRGIASVGFYLSLYLMSQGVWSGAASIALGLGVSEPAQWRPLFGSLTDAWTIRRLWGNTWHQIMRSILSEPASWLAHGLLRLPRDGLFQRYFKLVLAFGLSGVVHAIGDYAGGNPIGNCHPPLQFFLTQAGGIMLEDFVQWLWRRFAGEDQANRAEKAVDQESPPLWKRTVGYTWVAGWLYWSTAAWLYPGAARAKPALPGERELGLLPFSVISLFRRS